MKVPTICLLFILLVCISYSKGDLVEDVQNKLKDSISHIDGDLVMAKEQLNSLKNKYSISRKKRKEMFGKIQKANKDEYEKLKKKKKDVEATMKLSKNKLDEIKKIAVNLAKDKMNDFQKNYDDFAAFLTGKQNVFQQKQDDLESQWEIIGGIDDWMKETKEKLSNMTISDSDVMRLQKELYLITRQVQLQQFNEEEKARSDGNSGIKQIRSRSSGAKNYFSNTHSGNSFAAIHNHANNIRTIGMGEFVAVLNGVEFRTRHNDYRLRKAVKNDKGFHKTEDIKFPDVPPEVLNKKGPDAQIKEMREWFKAFYNQDHSRRDYRKYFKPVMTYLEGAWTTKNGDKIDEPFESDRHHIEAKGWFDLQEKIHFTSYSGTKSRLENLAHLPTTIMDFTENGKPIFAQWNYRLLCHPLERDLPLKHLKLVPDVTVQKMRKWDDKKYRNSRAAKFDLEGVRVDGRRVESPLSYSLLDTIMEEIPGKDNYGATVRDAGFDSNVFSTIMKNGERQPLNAANYHRSYKLEHLDAMGVSNARRGYADRFYLALTTQERISGPSYTKVTKNADGKYKKTKIRVRASYAIPVEIIYLTPLANWNPYNIAHQDDKKNPKGKGTFEDPFTHTIPKLFSRTPHSFFNGEDTDTDPADTAKAGGVYFLSQDSGKPVAVRSSGVRVTFPPIEGIPDEVRQRYPIMPIYGEGSSVWKNLNAIEDSIDFESVTTTNELYYSTGISHSQSESTHSHIVTFNKAEIEKLKKGEIDEIVLFTERGNSHMHKITVKAEGGNLVISECDTPPTDTSMKDVVCWDNHSNELKTSSEE